MKKKKKTTKNGGFSNMTAGLPDKKEKGTGVALPSDSNVEYARNFVNENKK